jgi:hypothetical protein
LPFLSWLDVSGNGLAGTIPPSLGDSTSIDDFRAAENMLYGSIPSGLCSNTKLNAGSAKRHGCHGVLCPVGTYCETGFANVDEVCLPCPEGSTSLYLGSTSCIELGMNDFLAMLYEVTHTSLDPLDNTLDMVDDTHSICDWQGVFCDEDGQATSLMFPLHATVDE